MFLVAENVLSRHDLTLEGVTLEVSTPQDVWDRKTIKVCGLKPSTTDDAILLFFASNRVLVAASFTKCSVTWTKQLHV